MFASEEMAKEAIEEMKKLEDKDYFDGSFIACNDQFLVFQFKETLPASNVHLNDLHLTMLYEKTDAILKPMDITIDIDANIVCVPFSHLQQEMEKGKEEVLKTIKKLKFDKEVVKKVVSAVKLEQKGSMNSEAGSRRLPCVTNPVEVSAMSNIVEQFRSHAKSKGLVVYGNQSKISPYSNNFSKYAKSRPDIVSYDKNISNFSLVSTKDTTKLSLLFECKGQDDIMESLANVALSCEAKLLSVNARDPVGQMFAGIDKTFADLFHFALIGRSKILTECTIYGLLIHLERDRCSVYKVNIRVGSKTVVHQGKEEIGIKDALNRVLSELILITPH